MKAISKRKESVTDARPINSPAKPPPASSKQRPPRRRSSSHVPTEILEAPVERDSSTYNMNHPRRGRAVIFNNVNFNLRKNKREGSDEDAKNLTSTYEMLGFEVKIFKDLTANAIKRQISNLAKMDYSNDDCLIISVLTHGEGDNILQGKDDVYLFDHLWTPFTGDRCPTLAGKPKIFVIQACRGTCMDSGVTFQSSKNKKISQTDSRSNGYRIPNMADFLFAYSTFEGFFAWRNSTGSCFIQSFCSVLKEHYKELDLLSLLTKVSHKVATGFQSTTNSKDTDQKLQMPCIHSTLIRTVYFKPKN